ncbi:MAG: hypothetical protein A2107_13810 [Verrucomicrobia bacterium GWF2_62_7]|nr:MAG: hypothetical protein A2107_13810 [Verrucomicrobia bacterium GWF2_62_7]
MSQPARTSIRGVIWLALFILALTAFLVTYIPRLREAQHLRVEKYKLDEQLREQEAEHNRQLARQQALTNDPREVERAAREKLKLAKPGETVFRFEQGNNAPPPRNP